MDKKPLPRSGRRRMDCLYWFSYGIGPRPGTLAAGWIFAEVMSDVSASLLVQWQWFWLFPLILAVVVTGKFVFGFKEEPPGSAPARLSEEPAATSDNR